MQALDLLVVQLRALLERREPRLPEDLVDPGAADPGDVALVAQQRVQVAGLVDQPRRTPRAGAAARLPGPSVATISSSATASAGSSFAQARCLVPNSRRRSSRPSSSRISTREARSFERGPFVEELAAAPPTSGGSAAPGRRTRPPASCRPAARRSPRGPTSASSGGSKVFITFIPGASADSTSAPRERGVQPARGDLDLGQLGHPHLGEARAAQADRLVPRSFDWFEAARPGQRTSGKEGLHAGAPDDPTHFAPDALRPRRSLRSARRSARSPPSATR